MVKRGEKRGILQDLLVSMVVDEIRVGLVAVITYAHLLIPPCPLKNRAKTNYNHPPLTVVALVCNLVVIACKMIANFKTEDLGKEGKIDVNSSTSPCIDGC